MKVIKIIESEVYNCRQCPYCSHAQDMSFHYLYCQLYHPEDPWSNMVNEHSPIPKWCPMQYALKPNLKESKLILFEKVFNDYVNSSKKEWYEVFDSEDFEKVKLKISEILGYSCDLDEDFKNWKNKMVEDL